MGRQERINQLLVHLRTFKKYTNLFELLNQYSFLSGVSVRTLEEYITVLQSADLITISYSNPDPDNRIYGAKWLVPT